VKICPICAEWRYRHLVSTCPLCLAPGGLHEVEDLAGDFIRRLEADQLVRYCHAFDAAENKRLTEEGFFPRKVNLADYGFEAV
jgi:hypothetical protein